jgi:hypothetical protein
MPASFSIAATTGSGKRHSAAFPLRITSDAIRTGPHDLCRFGTPLSAMVCRARHGRGWSTPERTRDFFHAGSVSSSSIRVAHAMLA